MADTKLTPAEVLSMAADGSGVQFMTFKSAAKGLLGDATPDTKAEIVIALEELATSPDAPAQPAAPALPPVSKKSAAQPIKTTPIKLIRDTWRGEERIPADGSVTEWPIEDAKRLIAGGVATRADPLPGE